jgi:DNA-binding CsgD family transcriptional regulator
MARDARRASQDGIGFLLTDLEFNLLYANDTAVSILCFPEPLTPPVAAGAAASQRIRSIFDAGSFNGQNASVRFVSGRRWYVCHGFPLKATVSPAAVGLLLQREGNATADFAEIGLRFHLSPRERETIQHLVRGLTTKEIAERMGVSPNTTKQFVRLIMGKMDVTTRTAIVAKILESKAYDAYDVRLSRRG